MTVIATSVPAPENLTASVVVRLLQDGLAFLDDNGPVAKDCIARAHRLLEAELELALGTLDGSAGLARGGLAPWQAKRVRVHIEEHLEGSIAIDDLAAAARLSAHYFTRAFKQTFGQTPHAYVFNRRMERAAELMLTTDEPLARIAIACGFADQAHFTRRFHRAAGAPPHAWRRARQNMVLAAG